MAGYMKKIDNLLNQIGDYYCLIDGEEVHIDGVLRRERDIIVFRAKVEQDYYKKLDIHHEELQFWGTTNGTPVTLLSVFRRRGGFPSGTTTVEVEFDPSQIIVGRCYKEEPKAIAISASITALNRMFSSEPLEFIYDFSKEKPYLLKFTYPDIIKTDDKLGRLEIFQTISRSWTRNEITHNLVPIIKYQFNNPIGIMDAVEEIAAARNLFSFFANGYLPLENISFADEQTQNIDIRPQYDISLYLNYPEEIAVHDEPFLIMTSDFENNFSQIWQNWLDIYKGAVPIPTLFYEIICNRSTRTNCFLNLAQAIEVYSDKYRKDEAEALAKNYGYLQSGNNRGCPLKCKVEDVLSFLNDCLEITDCNLPLIAQGIANMRNYYTHYNLGKYVAPEFKETYYATQFLRFVLLTIVYKTIGLSSEALINVRKRAYSTNMYYHDIEAIMRYASKKPKKEEQLI